MAIFAILTIGQDRMQSGIRCINSLLEDGVKVAVLWRDEASKIQLGQHDVILELWAERSGLSTARNKLLSELLLKNILENNDIVCFADDDGLWPSGMAHTVQSIFETGIPWALGTYGASEGSVDRNRFPTVTEDLSIRKICDRASSLGLYFRVDALKRVGKFAEDLGVGSALPVAEDTEYALRARRVLGCAPYRHQLVQIHAYASKRRPDRIAPSLAFLARYSLTYPIILIPLAKGTFKHLFLIKPPGLLRIFRELFNQRRNHQSLNWTI